LTNSCLKAPHPGQLLLADPQSIAAKRALFAQHHIWVTKHQDGDLWCGGKHTNQSFIEKGGLQDMIARGDNVENEDIILWHTFGLTHIPRVEDFPVMPVEIHNVTLKPCDFFDRNPAMDVPQSTQSVNKSQSYQADVAPASGANTAACCDQPSR